MITTEAILTDCRRHADAVAGDLLSDRPLYLATDQPRVGDCLGWTTPDRVPAPIRQKLVEAGQWQGPGVFIALDIEALREQGGDIIEASRRLLVHELAHNYPIRPLPRDIEPSVVRVAMEAQAIKAWVQSPSSHEVGRPHDRVNDHDCFHARRCVHLAHRSARAGFGFDIAGVCMGWAYSVGWPAIHLADILKTEVRRMEGVSLNEVELLPFSDEFRTYYEGQVKMYESFQEPKEQKR